jgi:DNA repair photolyase
MAEHYGNTPRITYEFPDCSMPMAFDTYNNCSFGCMYCFAQNQRGIGSKKKEYLHKEVKDVSVERIKRMFIDPDKHGGDFAPYIKARKVMQWGSMSDQFDNFERKYGTTLELLRFFKDIDYPLCFSTKGAWFTKDERYMDLIRGQKNWNFKFSIITSDAEKARVIERGVESPQARLEAIERIANAGAGGATLRLRPFIIGVSTPTYLDLIKEAFNRGATALSTEFFCLETRSPTLRELLPTISKMAGFDILAFYKKYSVQSGYLRLNRKVKEPFFRNMKELCDQLGMRFYVSDAHFKELCHNGSCCGLPTTWNYSRGQMCEALNICKRKGYVRWSDIKLDAEIFLRAKLDKAMNMGTREKCSKYYTMSAADYMKWCWNNPQAAHSPYKMFEGAMIPADERDSEGNIVYKYNGAKF